MSLIYEGAAMKKLTATEIAQIPINERVQLVEDIWDSIADTPEQVNVPEWHKQELDKRISSSTTEGGSSWQEVKSRIQG